jgi:hypothetical protein
MSTTVKVTPLGMKRLNVTVPFDGVRLKVDPEGDAVSLQFLMGDTVVASADEVLAEVKAGDRLTVTGLKGSLEVTA